MSLKIKNAWNKLRFWLSFLLLAFYLVVGCLLLFSPIWEDILPKGRTIAGAVLVLFAILRFYVAYRRYKNKHQKIQSLKMEKQLIFIEN